MKLEEALAMARKGASIRWADWEYGHELTFLAFIPEENCDGVGEIQRCDGEIWRDDLSLTPDEIAGDKWEVCG